MYSIHRNASIFFALATVAVAALCKAADDPASAAPALVPEGAQAVAARPAVVLLLPLDAPDFAPPAEAVLAGCKAALSVVDGAPAIEVVRTDDSIGRVMAGYEAASARRAAVIVGPMTRGGVTALATSGRVRSLTLALNAPEQPLAMPKNLYAFGLSIDAEARQIARSAWADNLRDAVVVQSSSALSKRISQAFAQEWFALGGRISDALDFDPQTDLTRIHQRLSKSDAGLIFLAADPDQARAVRPYLNNQIPVFATSQINSGRVDPVTNVDLNGIRFVEMPWLAQPDNMTAMIYPRSDSLAPELQRFYALGIDACRIANEFLNRRLRVNLEGVTGTLTLRPTGYVEREAMPSVFRDGSGVAIEAR